MRIWVIFLFVVLVLLKLGTAMPLGNFVDDWSYDIARQVQETKQHLTPLFYDELSYGGSERTFNPVLFYLISLVPFSGDVFYLHILHIVLMCTFLFVLYGALKELKANKQTVLYSLILFSALPIFHLITTKTISLGLYAVLLCFVLVKYYIRYFETFNRKVLNTIAILHLVGILVHPLFGIFLIGLIIYYLFAYIRKLQFESAELEVLLFSIITYITLYYTIYFDSFQLLGFGFFLSFFSQTSFIGLSDFFSHIPRLGLIIFLLVIPALYAKLPSKDRFTYFAIAHILGVVVLTLLYFVSADIAFFIIITYAILFVPSGIQHGLAFFRTTKIAQHAKKIVYGVVLATFILLSISSIFLLYSIQPVSVSSQNIEALLWLKNNNPAATIVVPPDKAFITMYYTGFKTLADQDVLLQPDSFETFSTIDQLYNSIFLADTNELLQKLGIKNESFYVIESDYYFRELQRNRALFLAHNCFEVIYDEAVTIYQYRCN